MVWSSLEMDNRYSPCTYEFSDDWKADAYRGEIVWDRAARDTALFVEDSNDTRPSPEA